MDEYFEATYPDTARIATLSQIADFVKKGESAQLIGLPTSGRSIILRLLAHNSKVRSKHFGKNSKFHFVLIDFSEIKNRSLFDCMKFFFLSLSDSLRARGMDEEYKKVNQLFKESLSFNDELVLFQALKDAFDYLILERNLNITLLFDRFEEYIPSITDQFFTNLRTLRSRAIYKFSVIFSLTRPLETMLDPLLLADFYELIAGNLIFLSLADSEINKTRIKHIEKVTGKKLSSVLFDELTKLTGGAGKLLKISTESILANQQFNNLAIEQLSKNLLPQKPVQKTLSEILRSLTPEEQSDLLTQKYDNSDVEEYFEKIGLVKNKRIQIPLFEEYLKSDLIKNSINEEKIFYDKNTNTIKKGETTVSDQLTSSEFLLLRHLLQNKGQVITRDDIISAVWPDVKSTAGITDQAVDQLIFRLRRKIEENPASPVYLFTIKGRGFKFES